MRLSRAISTLLLTLVLGVVIGCGGSSSTADDAGPSSGGDMPAGQSTTVDLAKSAKAIDELKSFRFDFTMKLDIGSTAPSNTTVTPAEAAILKGFFEGLTNIKAEGAYVAPDKTQIKVTVGDEPFEGVNIAGKSWLKVGGIWQVVDGVTVTSSSTSPGDFLNDFLPSGTLTPAKTSRENVNGVSATRYTFDKKSLEQMAKAQGESLDADFQEITEMNLNTWVADNGVPVKVSMSFAGKDDRGEKLSFSVEMHLRDMNSTSIQIKAPI